MEKKFTDQELESFKKQAKNCFEKFVNITERELDDAEKMYVEEQYFLLMQFKNILEKYLTNKYGEKVVTQVIDIDKLVFDNEGIDVTALCEEFSDMLTLESFSGENISVSVQIRNIGNKIYCELKNHDTEVSKEKKKSIEALVVSIHNSFNSSLESFDDKEDFPYTPLLKYTSLKQKEKYFGEIEEINDINSFFRWIYAEKMTSLVVEDEDCEFFYRGQADASWSVSSSLRREWKGEEGYIEFICRHCNDQQDNLRNKKFDNIQEMFSFMQHYGKRTPFIDFTSDIDVALHFAFSKKIDPNPECEKAINDYVSIYKIQGRRFQNVEEMIGCLCCNEKGPTPNDFRSASLCDFLHTPYPVWEREIEVRRTTNERMSAQKGILCYCGKYASLPLELGLQKLYGACKDLHGEKELECYMIKCTHIHRKLICPIREYLLFMGITDKALNLPQER